jgi:putative ABC transport system substrate-binding protein
MILGLGSSTMKRREFIALLGGAAVAWPLAARGQQREPMRRIGILLTVHESDPATQAWLAGFQRRLRELGWTDDRNVRFERRWAGGDPERMRANIAEVVGLAPDVILAQNTPMVAALRKQTDSIPIIFVQVSDPVGDGFVETLARPGGNVTGFTNTMSSLGGKWVELLREAAPGVSRVGYLFNRPAAPGGGAYYMEPLLSAAAALGLNAVPLELHNDGEIDTVIADFTAAGGNGMVANSDSFITVNRARIIAAANRHRLPTIYSSAAHATSGGLLSYGADVEQQWQAAASYVDRILRGEKPRDLPVQQPSKFVLTINLKTAKAIGLDVPWFLQQRADEVIE